jgi:hypothetical protein
MQTDVIRRISIQATQSGVAETTDGLKKLSGAQDNVAIASDKQQKAHLSVATALEKQQRSLDIAYRSTQQFEKAQRDLDQAQQQGLVTAQRYAELSALNTSRLKDQTSAANDNAKGWNLNGVEIASVANHAKQAAIAAYALSPAFRELVNPAIAAGLSATGSALAAIGPTAATVAGAVASRLLPALGLMLRVAGPLMLLVDEIKLIQYAWNSASEQIEKYNRLSKDASTLGVTPDFLQRLGKSFEDAGGTISDATELLKKFKEVSADKLGGSDLQKKIDAHIDAGNLNTNTGVDAFSDAISSQDKLRAVVDLLKQMTDEGKKLAALDIASTFASPAQMEAFRANDGYFKQMLASADAIASTKLVNQQDIDDAVQLKNRYDEAAKILSERWIPFQQTITDGGVGMQRVWVGIVELLASAVTSITNFAIKVGELISSIPMLGTAIKAMAQAALNVVTGGAYGAVSGIASSLSATPTPLTGASGRLATGLLNPNSVAAARDQTTGISNFLRRDTSLELNKDASTKAQQESNDQVDRAINTLRRHVEQQKADTEAVGLGAGALARFRAEAAETSAIQANGGEITAKQTAEFEKLKIQAYDTATALAKAKVASQIDFANQTKFLPADEVAIAQQLREIYGNDVPKALASTEAAQLRVINLQKDMKDSFAEVGKAAFSAALQGKLGMDSLISTLDSVAKKLSDKAFDNLTSLDPDKMVIGAVQAGASAVISLFTGDQKAKQELQKAQQAWAAMSMQVVNFNLAAKGFNLGPLTNELQSLYNSSKQLQDAALKAKDQGGAASAASAFNNAVDRIWAEFKNGTQTLTPLEQQIKAVNDEAAGLKDTLDELGFKGRAATIDSIVQTQIDALTKQFNATFISGLTARLNTATGQTFLTDAANLLVQHQQDLTQVSQDFGNDPTLLAQVAATFKAEAQKIVDGAGLAGTALTDFTTQFPALQGVVHDFTQSAVTDAKALQDAQNSAAKSVTDYLNGLVAGPGSTQSPTATLASAQTLYQANLPLAQAGNVDAQNKFVSLADNLEKAARVVYASGQGYQDIKNQIINQGLNLPAVQTTTDPVTQAVRDAITAIQIGTQATQGVTGVISGTLKPAVDAGNAAAVAASLATYFNQIDPSGRLASIFGATKATADQTTFTSQQVYTQTGQFDTSNNLTGSGNATLTAIQGLQGTAKDQLVLLANSLAPSSAVTGPTITNTGAPSTNTAASLYPYQLVAGIDKIVYNTAATAHNTGLSVPASAPSGQGHLDGVFRAGGLVTGPGTGTSDSIAAMLSNREFVIKNAAVERFGVGFFEQLNAGIMPRSIGNDNIFRPIVSAPNVLPFRNSNSGSDNAALLPRIDKLTEQVEVLQKIVAGSGANVARAVVETGEKNVEATDRQTSTLASTQRQSDRQRKVS